jgi:hypothetical protein
MQKLLQYLMICLRLWKTSSLSISLSGYKRTSARPPAPMNVLATHLPQLFEFLKFQLFSHREHFIEHSIAPSICSSNLPLSSPAKSSVMHQSTAFKAAVLLAIPAICIGQIVAGIPLRDTLDCDVSFRLSWQNKSQSSAAWQNNRKSQHNDFTVVNGARVQISGTVVRLCNFACQYDLVLLSSNK